MKKLGSNKGFTLVEMIVAVGLFGVAVSIAIGALVSLFNANSRAQSIASIMNNLNYSIENMARIVRFSQNYHCGGETSGNPYTNPHPCPSGDTSFAVSTSSVPIVFRLNSSKIQMSYGGTVFTDVTSNEVNIQYARFYIFNTTPGDNNQPYMLMHIRGIAGTKPSNQSPFDIQTVVSQRKLDL